jgi:dihydroorotase
MSKNILIKQAILLDPRSKKHGKKVDILIEKGIITGLGGNQEAPKSAEVVEGKNIYVSAGWFDGRANFCDPGHEYKEDIASGSMAALYGGFTGVSLVPETEPVISSKTHIEYILSKSGKINLYPQAYLSSTREHTTISEMHDLANAGALAFSAGYSLVQDYGFLQRAMQYAAGIGKPVILLGLNKSLASKGQVNEGLVSVQLGLKPIPSLAEEVEISTILQLVRYTGARTHISCISTAAGIQKIIEAHAEGLPITADVSVHHLFFSEEDVLGFNTNLKLKPPLRSDVDRKFLRDAVETHSFIGVVTDHTPHEEDAKKCEFEHAAYGATGLQTCFSQLLYVYGKDRLELITDILARRNRDAFGIAVPEIAEGARAELTLFDPTIQWTLDIATNKSKSRNSPLWEQPLWGKAIGVVNSGEYRNLAKN